ncbi:hypothetical protein NS506_03223 [Nocardia seriolae]|uniref:Uncharacterized protein n=1 Tax=Nocardia seriolae TaxID=37332 RepID=A0ABC8ASK5_9NOCA|nr:hypothetical protein NS506_03223 [Nocardia seriolae]
MRQASPGLAFPSTVGVEIQIGENPLIEVHFIQSPYLSLLRPSRAGSHDIPSVKPPAEGKVGDGAFFVAVTGAVIVVVAPDSGMTLTHTVWEGML